MLSIYCLKNIYLEFGLRVFAYEKRLFANGKDAYHMKPVTAEETSQNIMLQFADYIFLQQIVNFMSVTLAFTHVTYRVKFISRRITRSY